MHTYKRVVCRGQSESAFLCWSTPTTAAMLPHALPALRYCLSVTQGNIGIAFDLMSLNLADLPRVPLMVPALGVMFPEEEEEAEAMEEAE